MSSVSKLINDIYLNNIFATISQILNDKLLIQVCNQNIINNDELILNRSDFDEKKRKNSGKNLIVSSLIDDVINNNNLDISAHRDKLIEQNNIAFEYKKNSKKNIINIDTCLITFIFTILEHIINKFSHINMDNYDENEDDNDDNDDNDDDLKFKQFINMLKIKTMIPISVPINNNFKYISMIGIIKKDLTTNKINNIISSINIDI